MHPHVTLDAPSVKTCTKCGEVKSASEFHINRSTKDGLHAWCKSCNAADAKRRRIEDPDRHRTITRTYHDKHREELNAAYRERIASDPEYRKRRNDKSRRWRQNKRDHIAEYNATRYDNQPEMMRAAVKASRLKNPDRTRARKAVAWAVKSGKFPPAWTMVCEHCQEALASDYHHHKGYSEEFKLDVVALCTECHGKAHWVD